MLEVGQGSECSLHQSREFVTAPCKQNSLTATATLERLLPLSLPDVMAERDVIWDGQLGSAVLAVSPHSFLPTLNLLADG